MRLFVSLVLVGLASLGCDQMSNRQPAPGLYARTSTRLFADGRIHKVRMGDEIDAGLPPSIRIEANKSYEIDARLARIRGEFRLERDSIFFDEGDGQARTVTFAGRTVGDTLLLRFLGAAVALEGPPDTDVTMTFIRRRP